MAVYLNMNTEVCLILSSTIHISYRRCGNHWSKNHYVNAQVHASSRIFIAFSLIN